MENFYCQYPEFISVERYGLGQLIINDCLTTSTGFAGWKQIKNLHICTMIPNVELCKDLKDFIIKNKIAKDSQIKTFFASKAFGKMNLVINGNLTEHQLLALDRRLLSYNIYKIDDQEKISIISFLSEICKILFSRTMFWDTEMESTVKKFIESTNYNLHNINFNPILGKETMYEQSFIDLLKLLILTTEQISTSHISTIFKTNAIMAIEKIEDDWLKLPF